MKSKVRSKRLLPILFSLPLAAIFPLTSCGLNQEWDFGRATKDATEINYCLLIGQNDHTDSIERTRWTRSALNTLDITEETRIKSKDNPNIAKPIQGYIEVTNPITQEKERIVVNEIEQMEQKSMAGSPWDPITANNTTATWIAKHGHNITFFVSNNDGMAEGAIWASNWIKGMPIFGYDANATTLQWINAGNITGTVDQNASTQTGTGIMLLRNMLEDRDAFWKSNFDSEKAHGFGSKEYNPMSWRGFVGPNANEDPRAEEYGYVDLNLITQYSLKSGEERQILSDSTAIAHLVRNPRFNNIDKYIKEDGSAKEPKDMFDEFTHIKPDAKAEKNYQVCQAYCNRAEAFLMSTLKPYFNEYANRLNVSLDVVEGDGSGEELVLNQIRSRPDKYDAFLINMSKTTSTLQYVFDLAKKAYNYENSQIGEAKRKYINPSWGWNNDPSWTGWEDWEDRLDTPLIFFNRQPHKDSGEIDYEIMNNKFFKYTYFIGADALAGGHAQGELIVAAINSWYEDWIKRPV